MWHYLGREYPDITLILPIICPKPCERVYDYFDSRWGGRIVIEKEVMGGEKLEAGKFFSFRSFFYSY